MILLHEYLTFKISYAKFPIILPIIESSPHNNKQFDGCLIKIKPILSILTKYFNKVLDVPVFFNWAIFYVDFVPQYLTFKISYAKYSVM